MRKSAYTKALIEAESLPTRIAELHSYFGDDYNPRAMAIAHIKKQARMDVDGLFDGEAVDVLQFGITKNKAQPNENKW